MDKPAKKMNIRNMQWATERAKDYIARLIARAEDAKTDARKDDRINNRYECRGCYYSGSRVSGQAMTWQPCMSCGEPQLYGCTDTDALCITCAIKHKLCKHCGGDIEMRVRRRNWPEAPNGQEN